LPAARIYSAAQKCWVLRQNFIYLDRVRPNR
jgi:hypothetical protein